MKIYTFQPYFVYQNLIELGYYHPFHLEKYIPSIFDSNDRWSFKESYLWLKSQMIKQNIAHENNNSHLIWGWYKWGAKPERSPDLRYNSTKNFYQNEKFVLMELDIPAERLCLTDYDGWHYVLNYWLLEKTKFSNKFNKQFNFYLEKPLSNPEAHQIIEQSWQKIFTFKECRKLLEITKKAQSIQATFFEIFYNDLKAVRVIENSKIQKVINHSK